jgi:hypothetical protein
VASPAKKSFLLRIDPVLWSQLERLAAAELRSVNAQIEFLLRDAVQRRRPTAPAGMPARRPGEPQQEAPREPPQAPPEEPPEEPSGIA